MARLPAILSATAPLHHYTLLDISVQPVLCTVLLLLCTVQQLYTVISWLLLS